MTALPDPAELAPSRDPAAYRRRRILSPSFWAMMSLAVLSVLAGVAIMSFGPRLFRARPSEPAPAPSATLPPESATASIAAAAAPPLVALTAPSPEVAALEGRLQRLENGQARTIDAAAAALAAAALSEASQGPGPFAGELAAYQRVLPGSQEARALAPLAAEGAPSRAALAAELTDVAAVVATAARAPGKRASVLEQIAYAVSKVVTVRRIDGSGGGADAALATAERRAAEGDLEGASAALRALPGAAQGPLRAWRESAARRISIDRRVDALRGQALADLEAAREGR
ncbi:MAG TPA: hypothetical protein VII63_02710 [Caulobacteraceae bacterium]